MAADDGRNAETITLPLHAESVTMHRRRRETARVRIQTATEWRAETVEATLQHEHVDIEHVPIGKFVETAPAIRQEGDVTIIPVMEEVLVVERRLRLREEIHIRRTRDQEHYSQTVQLREQHAVITRVPATANTPTNPEEPT